MTDAPLLHLEHILLPVDGLKPDGPVRLTIDRLEIRQGESLAIIGPNGSGKSTLLKLIMREVWPLILPDRPRPFIAIAGQTHPTLWEVREQLGVLSPALAETLLDGDAATVEETVLASFFGAYQLYPHHEVTDCMRSRAAEALARADAAELTGRWRHTLSTGELRRILIARMLVHRPTTLLLDEPTTGLDLGAAHRLLETLEQLAAEGISLLLVTHHLEEILPCMRRAILLEKGRIVADGEPEALLTENWLQRLFKVQLRIDWHEGHPQLHWR